MLPSRIGPWPYPQTLTRLEKLARNQHSSLVQKSVNYDRKFFIGLAPGVNAVKLFGVITSLSAVLW